MRPVDAALAYAEAGWYVLPIIPGTKQPRLEEWAKNSSFDPDVIRGWFERWPNDGVGLHAGRSGVVVFDLDRHDLNEVPDELRESLRKGMFQRSREGQTDWGHYLFVVPPGESYGNSPGPFKFFGDVRGKNGQIVVEPTPHPSEGGRYHWPTPGAVPALPAALRACLNAASNEAEPLRAAELDAFYAEHTDNDAPGGLDGIVKRFREEVDEGSSRHEALVRALTWAFRETRIGRFPAQDAAERLRAAYREMFEGVPGRRPDPGELDRVAKWAAAQALTADLDEIRARVGRPSSDGSSDIQKEIQKEIAKLRIRDRARELYAEEKARALLNQHPDRIMDGLAFLTEAVSTAPLWGQGDQVLWASGEGLMICGPQGVGKSTVVQQLMLARMGLRDPELFGLPVFVDERPILYLAMDRPPQIARSLRRMLDIGDETTAAAVKRQLVFLKGPPPFDAADAPQAFADWVAMHGREPGLVIVDSLKDLASGLAKDEVGAGVNAAMQLVLANGTEFIDLHHQRKANADNKKPDKLSDVYGNGWLTAGMGSVVLLWGEPGARTVELSHLKQPQEKVGPLMVDHTHGKGQSAASDPVERLLEFAKVSGREGISEASAVRALFGVGREDDSYDNLKKQARRRLDRLREDGELEYEAGARGGAGGGGKAARWFWRG